MAARGLKRPRAGADNHRISHNKPAASQLPRARSPMPFTLSHQVLDDVLLKHRLRPNDLAGIDRLFGGADGYYWYHTMRHMCPKGEVIVYADLAELCAALQDHENETAAEDEVKPQQLKEPHLTAIAALLSTPA